MRLRSFSEVLVCSIKYLVLVTENNQLDSPSILPLSISVFLAHSAPSSSLRLSTLRLSIGALIVSILLALFAFILPLSLGLGISCTPLGTRNKHLIGSLYLQLRFPYSPAPSYPFRFILCCALHRVATLELNTVPSQLNRLADYLASNSNKSFFFLPLLFLFLPSSWMSMYLSLLLLVM